MLGAILILLAVIAALLVLLAIVIGVVVFLIVLAIKGMWLAFGIELVIVLVLLALLRRVFKQWGRMIELQEELTSIF